MFCLRMNQDSHMHTAIARELHNELFVSAVYRTVFFIRVLHDSQKHTAIVGRSFTASSLARKAAALEHGLFVDQPTLALPDVLAAPLHALD